jgi:TP901 family phage tail tape measure protein
MFGLIGTAAMGAAASAAAKFSTQFTLAATQARRPGQGADATARIATNVQRQVMSLMQQFPASAQEMADSFYQIFSGTNIQNVKVATSAVRVFNQMAVAGGTDLKTMTDAGISLYNNFGGLHGEFKNLTQAGNAFFAAVRYGRMNAEQFANSLPNVLAIAKQVGLSFNDIAGAMATLTRQTGGKFTTRDATGIARMIEIFARPDFQAGAKKFGVSIKDDVTGNMRPLLDIIDEFSRKTRGRARIDMLSLFKEVSGLGSATGRGGTQGTIQARRAFAFLINDIDKYRNVSGLVRTDNNELSKSFEAMSKTPGVQWQLFVNRLRVLVYEIGTNAIPAFIALGRPVEHAVKWFNDLDDHTKHLIATITTFAAAGLLIVGVLSSMTGGVARLVTQFILMRRMRGLENMLTEFRATQAMAPPVGGGVGIINPRTGASFSETEAGAAARQSQRQSFMAPMPGRGRAAAVGAAGIGLIALPLLAQQSKGLQNIIDKIGGISTAELTLLGIMAGFSFQEQIAGFVKLGAAGVASAARTGTAWVASGIRTVATFDAEAIAARVSAISITVAMRGAALAVATAFRAALIATGWGALIIAASFAAAYIITHWDKVKGWFGRFWVYMRAVFAGGWQFIIQTGKGAIYLVLQYVTAAVRGILKVASFIPGIGGKAKSALRDINNLMDQFKPDYGKATSAFSGVLDKDAADRANAAKRAAAEAAARNAETKRWGALQNYWKQRMAAQQTGQRRNALDRLVGISAGASDQRTIQGWISAVINAKKAMDAHPYDLSKALAYEKIQKALNDRFKDQPQLLSAINDVLQTYTSNLDKASSAADKAAKKQQVTFEQVLSGLQNMYQQFLTQEQSAMGQLFQGPFMQHQDKFQWGGKVTAFDENRDIASQIKQFKDFHGLINRIRERGAPPELVAQLTALGPQAIDQIRAMARMSDPEIKKYFTLFRTSQKLIHDQTMADMRQQLADYRKYGRTAALQIIAGFQSADQGLTKALTRIIRNAFGKIPTEAQLAAQDAAKNAPKVPTFPKVPAGGVSGTSGIDTGSDGTRGTGGLKPLKMAPWIDPSGGRFDYRRIQHLSDAQYNQAVTVSNEWVGNWKRINTIVKKFNQRDLTRQNYSDIYKSLETEIRRELRRQHLPNLTNAQLERLIRNLFGLMPARAAQIARDQSKPKKDAPTQPTVERAGGAFWEPNLRRLSRIANEMGNLSTVHLSPRQYSKVYRDIMTEVKREIRSQGLKMPTEKGLENIIWRRLHIRPPANSDMPRRNTSSAAPTTLQTHYHITAPMSERSSILTQARHADFVIRNKNKPSR